MSIDAIPPEIAHLAGSLPRFEDGRIDYTHAPEAVILNCYVVCAGKLLLVKRGEKVGWLKSRWHVVGGFLDEQVTLRQKTLEELREELGLTEERVQGMHALPMVIEEGFDKRWILYRVIVTITDPHITLDWENTEYAWVLPQQLESYHLLPGVLATARIACGQ